ncbi:MAG: DUF1385 domain-containing protein [Clostridiales bacterium]|nr:DUF1385 domain-containing protein [Clostridiales bacterium]
MAKRHNDPACATVGGQAVMEGVMMQGPDRTAVAVRRADGTIALRIKPVKKLSDKYPILGWPVIRGVVNFAFMLINGMKTLTESAEMAGLEVEKPSKFEQKVAGWLRMKPDDVMMLFAVVLAIALAIGLFFALPIGLEALIRRVVSGRLALNLIGGLIRIAVFLAYVVAVSRLKEIRRVFQYHGAEHKAVFCYEKGQELTVENARPCSRLHPRCGTSFLVIVMAISILIFTLLGSNGGNVLARLGSRLALLPLVAGVSYEMLRWLGRAGDAPIVRALKWPGLMTQKITTAEPDDAMIEVALVSLKAALKMPNPLPDQDEAPQPEAQPAAAL